MSTAASVRDKKRAKAIIASRAAAVKRKWMAEQRAASRLAAEAGAAADGDQRDADDADDADAAASSPRKRTRLDGPAAATRRTPLAAPAASPSRSPSPLTAAAAAAPSDSSANVTPTKKLHWRAAAKLAAAAAEAAQAESTSADSGADDETQAASATGGASSSASSSAAAAAASAASAAGSSADAAATPARSQKSAIAIQRARETRERKAAIAAQRAATRAATMKKKAEAKAAGIILPPVGKASAALKHAAAGGSSAAASSAAAQSDPSASGVISTPPFRVVDIHKLAAVLNKFVVGGEVEDMSDKAFIKRHRELERDEAQIREEERRDSIVRWAICDSPTCRKWRVLAKNCGIPTDASVHWYCGGITSRNGGKPIPKNCARLDDWIIKCVGERLAKELQTAGITTVALFESKEKGQPPANLAAYSARMRKLGIYYDAQTQTLCKY